MLRDSSFILVPLEPFTGAAFQAFGHEIVFPDIGERTRPGPPIDNLRSEAQAMMNLTSRRPDATPLDYTEMERHRFSSQAFIPIRASRYIIVVAPSDADGNPDVTACRAFAATGRQGVIYNSDTWHCPLRVLDDPALFCVFLHRNGVDDEDFRPLVRGIRVVA